MDLDGELTGFAGHLASRGTSSNTQKAYLSDLRDLLGFLRDKKRDLDLDALRDWMWQMSEAGATKTTLARKTSTAKAFTQYLFERGKLVGHISRGYSN